MAGETYRAFHARSVADREGFWAEQAKLVDWHQPFGKVLDYSRPPFAKWFVGGETNLCYNALDRHLATRGDQKALVWISTEVEKEATYTYRELAAEAMLACARIGAIHSVVFGGFASHSLASRIDDARPKLIISADGGMRAGKVVQYKPLLDEAIRIAAAKPEKVLLVNRGLDTAMARVPGRDVDWADLLAQHLDARGPVAGLEADEPSDTLDASGTAGRPKGVQRYTGGYAV